jgi:hypothetical protein
MSKSLFGESHHVLPRDFFDVTGPLSLFSLKIAVSFLQVANERPHPDPSFVQFLRVIHLSTHISHLLKSPLGVPCFLNTSYWPLEW